MIIWERGERGVNDNKESNAIFSERLDIKGE